MICEHQRNSRKTLKTKGKETEGRGVGKGKQIRNVMIWLGVGDKERNGQTQKGESTFVIQLQLVCNMVK